MTRYTMNNQNGSFRVPVERLGEFRILQTGHNMALFGDIIDRLGRYEQALTPEEAEEYARTKRRR